MSKRPPTMEELVLRPVVRKYVDSEWMSKMSAKEYFVWEEGERMTYLMCRYPKHEHDARLQQQIEFKEMEYKLRKEQIESEEKIIRDGADGLIVSSDNGLHKHNSKNTCLGSELVSYNMVDNPSVSGAVLTASTRNDGQIKVENVVLQEFGKVNKNGRIYDPKAFDNIVRWDKYEKLTKRIMRDNGYGI